MTFTVGESCKDRYFIVGLDRQSVERLAGRTNKTGGTAGFYLCNRCAADWQGLPSL
jgi:hypothetical protein